jgi:hypothetical protein
MSPSSEFAFTYQNRLIVYDPAANASGVAAKAFDNGEERSAYSKQLLIQSDQFPIYFFGLSKLCTTAIAQTSRVVPNVSFSFVSFED